MKIYTQFFYITLFLCSQALIASQQPAIKSGFVIITYKRDFNLADSTVKIVSLSSFPHPGHISDGNGGGQFVAGFIHEDGREVRINPKHLEALCANPQWKIIREPEIFERFIPWTLDPENPK